MEHQELVHTEEKGGFTIKLYLCPEHTAPDWDFTDVQEEKELLERIDNGSMLWFCAKVTASKAGIELGTDYLGGCCYPSVAEFMASDGYYPDMVKEAISCAKATLAELCCAK